MRCILPLYVHTTKSHTKKGKFILNLNNYRNAQTFKLNTSKINYKELIKEQIERLPKAALGRTFKLVYTYFHGNNRKVDVANPCSIIDKYFSDALTELEFWEDDNCDYLKEVVYKWGGVDKENPRCEVDIIII